jgi:hypothetical protein
MNTEKHLRTINYFSITLILLLASISLHKADRKPALESDFERLWTVIVMSARDQLRPERS